MKIGVIYIWKEISGITLIALIITIIVLLILAGVTISTFTGQGSIIDNAKNSKWNNNKCSSRYNRSG